MVPTGGRPPRRGSLEQSLEQSAKSNLVAEQCKQPRTAKQNLRIEGSIAKRTEVAGQYSKERTKTPSRLFPTPASRARRLREGGAQAVRRICPDEVDGRFSPSMKLTGTL